MDLFRQNEGEDDDSFFSSNLSSTQNTQPIYPSQPEDLEQDSDGGTNGVPVEYFWGRLTFTKSSSCFGRRVFFKANEVFIGRDQKCTVCLNERSISTNHAQITRRADGSVILVDTSVNGTFLNGSKLSSRKEHDVHGGDIIAFVKREPPNPNNRHASRVKNWFEACFEVGKWDTRIYSNVDGPSQNTRNPFSSPPFFSKSAANCIRNGPINRNDSEALLSEEMSKKYICGKKLGDGTFATVYQVSKRDTREEFAVKIIKKHQFKLAPPQKWKDQLNEANLLKRLKHPNVARLHEIYEDNRGLYLVMELIRGGELFHRIVDKGPFEEAEAKRIVRNILDAVSYLHDNNVIHRDLKPENILLVSNNQNDLDIKLVDFGVAKEAENGRTTVCGTLDYIAPEVLARKNTVFGRTRYGKEADMWSLGVVTYVILTATALFPSASNFDNLLTMQKRVREALSGPVWRSRKLSINAQEFVSSLLEVSDGDRLTARKALNHPWIKSIATLDAMKIPQLNSLKLAVDNTQHKGALDNHFNGGDNSMGIGRTNFESGDGSKRVARRIPSGKLPDDQDIVFLEEKLKNRLMQPQVHMGKRERPSEWCHDKDPVSCSTNPAFVKTAADSNTKKKRKDDWLSVVVSDATIG